MKQNVWATYFHRMSSDEIPQHGLCPKGPDSWCKYNKAQALNQTHHHKNSLPVDITTTLKKIYQDLANPEFLKKCLHGHTQNPNESFNSVVWLKVPKLVFVRLNTLKLDAVSYTHLDVYKRQLSGSVLVNRLQISTLGLLTKHRVIDIIKKTLFFVNL